MHLLLRIYKLGNMSSIKDYLKRKGLLKEDIQSNVDHYCVSVSWHYQLWFSGRCNFVFQKQKLEKKVINYLNIRFRVKNKVQRTPKNYA